MKCYRKLTLISGVVKCRDTARKMSFRSIISNRPQPERCMMHDVFYFDNYLFFTYGLRVIWSCCRLHTDINVKNLGHRWNTRIDTLGFTALTTSSGMIAALVRFPCWLKRSLYRWPPILVLCLHPAGNEGAGKPYRGRTRGPSPKADEEGGYTPRPQKWGGTSLPSKRPWTGQSAKAWGAMQTLHMFRWSEGCSGATLGGRRRKLVCLDSS